MFANRLLKFKNLKFMEPLFFNACRYFSFDIIIAIIQKIYNLLQSKQRASLGSHPMRCL